MLTGLTRRVASLAALVLLCGCATSAPAAPAEPELPPIQRFTGRYFQNFEVQGFRADGGEELWWVRTSAEAREKLFAAYPRDFRPPPTGFAIIVEVDARVTEPGRYGHLGAFPRGIYFTDVISARPVPIACSPVELFAYFDANRAEVSATAIAQIEAALDELRRGACNVSSVRLTGSTDTTGSAAYNLVLSERRAGAVRELMIARGVAADMVALEARGEDAPWLATRDNVNEPLNRSVRIAIESPHGPEPASAAPASSAAPAPEATARAFAPVQLGAAAPALLPASFSIKRRLFSPPTRHQPENRRTLVTAEERARARRH